MMEWKCLELHSHTLHSDGAFSVGELCAAAKSFLYDGIALTDHNTMSGLDELNGEAPLVPVIPGIEWTTFYGHMLVIGAEKYVDWRFVRSDTIDEYTREIKEAGGVIGIAHPFQMGSPMCTGCYWDFKVRDWHNIDYIEVWSNSSPQKRYKNTLAFSWWTGLLNQGHRLAASAGWDWHRPETERPVLPAATWLGLQDGKINTRAVKEALAAGRTIVSIGPFPELRLRRGGNVYYPGDTLERGEVRFSLALDEDRRKEIRTGCTIRTEEIRLTHNGEPIKAFFCPSALKKDASPVTEIQAHNNLILEESLDLAPGWYRIEGYGVLEDKRDTLLFFTSPWYVD